MKNSISKSFIISLLFVLSACATNPPDVPICIEMSLIRGECIKVISGEKITIDETHKYNNESWWEMRPTNLVIPKESWAELKKWIIKICKKHKNTCDKEISSWDRSVENIDENINEKIHGPIDDTADFHN